MGHRLLVIIATWTLHCSPDSTATRRSTRAFIEHTGKNDYQSPSHDPSFACYIIIAKLHEASPASNLSNMPSFPDPLAEVGSKTVSPKHRLYHPIPRI
jgi:hypothetical protein